MMQFIASNFNPYYHNDKKSAANKMKWLREENIISENEFKVVMDEINENLAT